MTLCFGTLKMDIATVRPKLFAILVTEDLECILLPGKVNSNSYLITVALRKLSLQKFSSLVPAGVSVVATGLQLRRRRFPAEPAMFLCRTGRLRKWIPPLGDSREPYGDGRRAVPRHDRLGRDLFEKLD
jgi:hypothetical protein